MVKSGGTEEGGRDVWAEWSGEQESCKSLDLGVGPFVKW